MYIYVCIYINIYIFGWIESDERYVYCDARAKPSLIQNLTSNKWTEMIFLEGVNVRWDERRDGEIV